MLFEHRQWLVWPTRKLNCIVWVQTIAGLAYQEVGLCCFPHLLLLWCYLSMHPLGSLSRVPADAVGLPQISPGLITQHGVTEYPNEDGMSSSHEDNFSMQTD